MGQDVSQYCWRAIEMSQWSRQTSVVMRTLPLSIMVLGGNMIKVIAWYDNE